MISCLVFKLWLKTVVYPTLHWVIQLILSDCQPEVHNHLPGYEMDKSSKSSNIRIFIMKRLFIVFLLLINQVSITVDVACFLLIFV